MIVRAQVKPQFLFDGAPVEQPGHYVDIGVVPQPGDRPPQMLEQLRAEDIGSSVRRHGTSKDGLNHLRRNCGHQFDRGSSQSAAAASRELVCDSPSPDCPMRIGDFS